MVGIFLLLISIILFNWKKYYYSLMIFMLFVTNGYQIISVNVLMAGVPLDKASDLSILFIIYIILTHIKLFKRMLNSYKELKIISYFIVFIGLNIIYSILLLDYSIVNVIQVARPYILLTSFVLFYIVPVPILAKVFHSLVIITLFQSILFIMQLITGDTILLSSSGTANIAVNHLGSGGYIRFYNTPVLLTPSIFYLIFVYKFKNIILHWIMVAILIITIVGPMHRSSILAFVAVLAIYVLIKQKSSKSIMYISILMLLMYAASFMPIIGERMNEAFIDIAATFSTNLSVANIDISENTTLFRIGHFLERFEYVIKQPLGWLFGIGLISDNAPYASKLPFEFGLTSEITGQIVQIDTSDLIWSPLCITLGIVGTLLYIYIFIKLLISFLYISKYNQYGIVGLLNIIYSFCVSTTSTYMLENPFRVVVILLFIICVKAKYMRIEYNDLEFRNDKLILTN